MTPFTPNPALGTWTSITFPDDLTDPKSVATVRVWGEALANKLVRMLDKTLGGTVAGDVVFNGAINFGGTSIVLHDSGCNEEFDNTPGFINGFDAIGGTFSFSGGSSSLTVHNSAGILIAANAGLTDVRAQVKLTGQGRITKRPPEEQAGTGNITRNASDADCIAYLGLTGDRTITLTSGTGSPGGIAPSAGDEIEITLLPLGTTVHTVHVVNDALNPLTDLTLASGQPFYAKFVYFTTGGWRPVDLSYAP